MGARSAARPHVGWATEAMVIRPARDEELSVMEHFSAHARHCDSCRDPLAAHMNGYTLCDRGLRYATDVAQYIYSKSGRAYSVIDRRYDEKVQIEVPANCDAVRGLLRAVDRGLRLRRDKQKPVISYDRTYPVAERRRRDEGHEIINVRPHHHHEEPKRHHDAHHRTAGHRDTFYVPSRGSLIEKDNEDRSRQARHSPAPVIITYGPRRRDR